MTADTYQINSLPAVCPEKFFGFEKPVSKMKNWSAETKVGYLFISECHRELGIKKIKSIDEKDKKGTERFNRADLEVELNHLLLCVMGRVSPAYRSGLLNYNLSIEIAPFPQKALQYLHEPRRLGSGEKGHNWQPISEGIHTAQADTTLNIIIATESDGKEGGIKEGGGPYQAIKQWESQGLFPTGTADKVVRWEVRPIEILRGLGIPVIVISDHVDDSDLVRMRSMIG